eukprot:TRINITY_DN4488_c1_g4_i1.p6 TRINITY_DN4488_c1_g4~~TRINITY_DN4488_c1_g4_i1.p6  ORF type:complete len:111 (-),score=3.31 TRINITY_DN4488_c1_g4_i1:204-536(-)
MIHLRFSEANRLPKNSKISRENFPDFCSNAIQFFLKNLLNTLSNTAKKQKQKKITTQQIVSFFYIVYNGTKQNKTILQGDRKNTCQMRFGERIFSRSDYGGDLYSKSPSL